MEPGTGKEQIQLTVDKIRRLVDQCEGLQVNLVRRKRSLYQGQKKLAVTPLKVIRNVFPFSSAETRKSAKLKHFLRPTYCCSLYASFFVRIFLYSFPLRPHFVLLRN
jgi:hypothetical protein